ncbi:hypothetical protein McpSp1_09650 [Methanocorpusculaceae archaeon Sp1]|nr:hypothetical protein [Methanocorpusculaceae archaeon Sp1]
MRVTNRTAIIGSLLCVLLICSLTGTVTAAETTITGQVIVTGYELDPKVFYPGDQGTLTVKLKNVGSTPVNVGMPTLLGGQFQYLNSKQMVPVGLLGAGGETSVSLQIKPTGTTTAGMAYPYFSVGYTVVGGENVDNPVRAQVPIEIDNSDLSIQMIEKPNMISKGSMGKYKLRIGNPRAYQITGLTISISGDGITSRQDGYFIGTVTANNYTDIEIDIATAGDTKLIIDAEYRNGKNIHSSTVEIPVYVTGSSSVVISDLVATKYNNKYTVTGSVYNPGLRDISSVVVVAGPPAVPEGSYQAALGVIEGNDNGEFELTFSVKGEATTVPIIVTYQDELNMYHQEQNVVSIIDYDLTPTEDVAPQSTPVLIPAFAVVGLVALGVVLRTRK